MRRHTLDTSTETSRPSGRCEVGRASCSCVSTPPPAEPVPPPDRQRHVPLFPRRREIRLRGIARWPECIPRGDGEPVRTLVRAAVPSVPRACLALNDPLPLCRQPLAPGVLAPMPPLVAHPRRSCLRAHDAGEGADSGAGVTVRANADYSSCPHSCAPPIRGSDVEGEAASSTSAAPPSHIRP